MRHLSFKWLKLGDTDLCLNPENLLIWLLFWPLLKKNTLTFHQHQTLNFLIYYYPTTSWCQPALHEEHPESHVLRRAGAEPYTPSLLIDVVFVVSTWAKSILAKLSSDHAHNAICPTLSLFPPLLFLSCCFSFAYNLLDSLGFVCGAEIATLTGLHFHEIYQLSLKFTAISHSDFTHLPITVFVLASVICVHPERCLFSFMIWRFLCYQKCHFWSITSLSGLHVLRVYLRPWDSPYCRVQRSAKAIAEVILYRSRLIAKKNGNSFDIVKGKGIERL